ncbi:unnamed protein product [Notodromas monacha]|uniref:Dystrophin n=1 Tax=Notodromas monacha TaxID=399045 RepID=A0A7R9BMI4_9CRUS|nr:unnamed protein product [Notodromas monacha]CAG0917127.1 unnamed protein product [Notodromas monacha]
MRGSEEQVGDPWAKNSSGDGVPYYVSRDGADTSWDHPMLGRVLSMLEDCNRIDYAAYRAATKLRMIQKRLNWDSLNVYPVASIMQHHALKPGEADTLVSIGKVAAVISDIFAYIAWIGVESQGFSFDLSSELTLNLFINIFDKKRRGQVKVLSVQTFLCLLCKDRPQGKLRYLFRQVSDHNNCCSRVKLATLLKEMSAVMEYLDEGWKFGLHTVGPAVESCFSTMCPGINGSYSHLRRQVCFGLTEEKYLQWMARHPQNIVWLFINHRLADSELVEHNVQCKACRQNPIVGLCYVCLQCWNVQLCQTCFLLGRNVSGHKKSHQMEEHSAQLTYSERFSVAVHRLLSVMRLSRPCVKKGPSFLPLDSSPQVAGDLVPVLTRSEDEASSRDGNPSPLPPPPPPPGGAAGHGYLGHQEASCSSRSSGVVVDHDVDARTPTSGNWYCRTASVGSSAASESPSSPAVRKRSDVAAMSAVTATVAGTDGGGGRVRVDILPVHQEELQSILWHFEEEQKQLKGVLGSLDTADGPAVSENRARKELEECSHDLETQLSRLRDVLKNYMRCSVHVAVKTNSEAVEDDVRSDSLAEEQLVTPDLEEPRQPFPGQQRQPLESTAMSTPLERGAAPYSPITGQHFDGGAKPSPLASKVVFRVKKLPASLRTCPGLRASGGSDLDEEDATFTGGLEEKAPLAEPETLGPTRNEIFAQFPSISLGDLSSTLLTMTQDMEIPRGSPCTLPYDQQAKRVSMINRELEGILRELDAVYPAVTRNGVEN